MSIATWKAHVDALRSNLVALYIASKDPRTPRLAKLTIIIVVAYALSPIDLIPDFIPVLGYLDDLLLLPLGLWLAIRLIPAPVWQDCKAQATEQVENLPKSRRAALIVVLIWLALGAWASYWILMSLMT